MIPLSLSWHYWKNFSIFRENVLLKQYAEPQGPGVLSFELCIYSLCLWAEVKQAVFYNINNKSVWLFSFSKKPFVYKAQLYPFIGLGTIYVTICECIVSIGQILLWKQNKQNSVQSVNISFFQGCLQCTLFLFRSSLP